MKTPHSMQVIVGGTDLAEHPLVAAPKTFSARSKAVATATVNSWLEHNSSRKGAALAYYTLFSLAPILILVISIAGAFFGEDAVRGGLMTQLSSLMGSGGAKGIETLLASAKQSGQGPLATTVAVLLLVVGATTVFAELKDGLDEIWHEDKKPGSGLWNLVRTRLLSFGLILTLAFLLMVSLLVSTALDAVSHMWLGWWPAANFIFRPLATLFSFVVITALFATIFKLLPQVHLKWADVIFGAFSTAILFIIGKFIIGAYLGNSSVATSYGAAGSIVALILWVYYSTQIFFFGAEFTYQHTLIFGSLSRHREQVRDAAPKSGV